MTEVSIRFHAMPGCPHIIQAPAHCATILTTGDHPDGPLKITGVLLNGAPLKFRAMDDGNVCVSPPIRYEGGRVELRGWAFRTFDAPPRPREGYPLPVTEYGLQRPSGACREAMR